MITLSNGNACLQYRGWCEALQAVRKGEFHGHTVNVHIGKSRFVVPWFTLRCIAYWLDKGETVHIQHGGECHHLQHYIDVSALFFNFPMHRAYVYDGVIKVI